MCARPWRPRQNSWECSKMGSKCKYKTCTMWGIILYAHTINPLSGYAAISGQIVLMYEYTLCHMHSIDMPISNIWRHTFDFKHINIFRFTALLALKFYQIIPFICFIILYILFLFHFVQCDLKEVGSKILAEEVKRGQVQSVRVVYINMSNLLIWNKYKSKNCYRLENK